MSPRRKPSFTPGHWFHGGKNLRIKSTGEPLSIICSHQNHCRGGDPFGERAVKKLLNACSHQWLDPSEPPSSRAPYSPVIGPERREIKRGTTYRCQRCGEILKISSSALPPEAARALGISYATARRLRREIR
jgi:hypothetical protein